MITLTIDNNKIAWVYFDLPDAKVNILSTPVMSRLDQVLDDLAADSSLAAIIFTSNKKDIFIAGADINEIAGITEKEEGRQKALLGQEVLNKIEKFKIPTLAVIDGVCLGGGAELVLCCKFRIASDNPKTKIGSPEVNLGIIPGFGGTQRLPRLVGLQKGLDLILSCRSLSAKEARKIGLVDKVAPQAIFEKAVKMFVQEILSKGEKAILKKRSRAKGLINFVLEKTPLGRNLVFSQAKKTVLKRTHGHYPAPLAAIEAIKRGLKMKLSEGLKLEAKLFGEMVITPVSKNLISLYYLNEEIKKFSGVYGPSAAPLPIKRSGVLGAGIMGSGIAQVLSYNQIPVRLKDINFEVLGRGLKNAASFYQESVKKKRMTAKEAENKMNYISPTTTSSGFKNVDLIIEAAFEDMKIKKDLIRYLTTINKKAIFASNTSSLSISEMSQSHPSPEKVIGMHFFNPAPKMPLIEVVYGKNTSSETMATIFQLAKSLGKTPILVKDSPGFLVNRILMPYLNEAAHLLQEGIKIETIDEAMLDFGMPMGPIALVDEVGIDIAYKVAKILCEAYGERMKPAAILERVFQLGRLGKKGKLGFYRHLGKKKSVDKTIYRLVSEIQRDEKIVLKGASKEQLQERMVLVMINEAARCLEERIVEKQSHLDMALIMGIGFPPFRGGLLKCADQMGIKKIYENLEDLFQKYGLRFAPAELLKNMAYTNKFFY